VGLLIAMGCSSSSSSNGGSGDPLQDCYALCGAEAQGQDCPSTETDGACRQICDRIVPRFSDDCRAKAEAYYSCGVSQGWLCEKDQVFPHATDSSCTEQSNAYGPCLGN
jgi:hypothetical protein